MTDRRRAKEICHALAQRHVNLKALWWPQNYANDTYMRILLDELVESYFSSLRPETGYESQPIPLQSTQTIGGYTYVNVPLTSNIGTSTTNDPQSTTE